MSYQGWENYPTWACALWISNEEGFYRYWLDQTKDIWEEAAEENQDDLEEASMEARIALANDLRQWLCQSVPDIGTSMFSDMLGWAIEQIDHYEIANNWLDDAELEGYIPKGAIDENN